MIDAMRAFPQYPRCLFNDLLNYSDIYLRITFLDGFTDSSCRLGDNLEKSKVVYLTGHGYVPRKALKDTCSIRSQKSRGDLADPNPEQPGTSRGPQTPGSSNDGMSIETSTEPFPNLSTSRPGSPRALHMTTSCSRFIDEDSK